MIKLSAFLTLLFSVVSLSVASDDPDDILKRWTHFEVGKDARGNPRNYDRGNLDLLKHLAEMPSDLSRESSQAQGLWAEVNQQIFIKQATLPTVPLIEKIGMLSVALRTQLLSKLKTLDVIQGEEIKSRIMALRVLKIKAEDLNKKIAEGKQTRGRSDASDLADFVGLLKLGDGIEKDSIQFLRHAIATRHIMSAIQAGLAKL